MPAIQSNYARTTSVMLTQQLYSRLRETQNELLTKQKEITTGKTVLRPSDASDKAAAILYLQSQLANRGQWYRNLDHAQGMLDSADAALGDAKDLMLEAKTIASSQVGVGSDATTRRTEAEVIQANIDGLLEVANRQFSGVSLFGGNNGAKADGKVFESFLGGIRYLGATEDLQNDTGRQEFQPFTSNGLSSFGALSSRVKTDVDLNPQATAATKLSSLGGATLQGVRKGPIEVSVDGTVVSVDLTTADTMGDVVTRINAAINDVDPAAGSLAVAGEGFTLTGAAGHTITIADVGSGKVAADMGIAITSGGAATAGAALAPKLTLTTPISALATTVDWASGITVTQGETTKTADFSGAATVEDLMNVVKDLGLGVRLSINEAGTGLDFVSEVSGLSLSVGENGGTTAQDLGIRTFGATTKLTDFRNGLGVGNVEGENDFAISLHDGRSFNVNIDGATTVGGVVGAINAAAAAAGIAPADFTAGLATTGNGIAMSDGTAGGGAFAVNNLGQSLAADHLGIRKSAGTGGTIAGDDVAKVRVENLFTHLSDLREALKGDDTLGITLAGTSIEDDLDKLVQSRAEIGVEAQRVDSTRERSKDLELTEKSMLSDLQDADLTEVITRFTQLQMQLQASMQVGAQNLQMSLLDYLR